MNEIKHYPKGEHPYKRLGQERIPFFPEAGEKVVVYAEKKGKANDMHLILNGKERVYPKIEESKMDVTNYSFEIGCFEFGQEIKYQLASKDEESDAFTFVIGKWEDIVPSVIDLENDNIRIAVNGLLDDIFIRFSDGNIVLSQTSKKGEKISAIGDGIYECGNLKIKIDCNPFSIRLMRDEITVISNIELHALVTDRVEKIKLNLSSDNEGVFGFGERFNGVNQIDKQPKNVVFEKFTQQGEITYLPIPFFYSTAQYAVFADTNCQIDYDLSEKEIVMITDLLDDIYIMPGSIEKAIKCYTELTGECVLPPKWSFGPWISANRWNCQGHIDEQIDYIKKYNYPTNAIVIEAWSDEATFYVFNEAQYEPKQGYLCAEEIAYREDGLWPNPQQMIDGLHAMGIKVILWQAPMIKLLEAGRRNAQQEIDRKEVIEEGLVVKNRDGSPYTIPKGYWFGGSYVPDFSNAKMCEWVAKKRKYLMDMGIDGFKTDGGEFIYYDHLMASNDACGKGIRNDYSYQYEKAYNDMLNDDGVLFSRAGYKGAQQFPIHWAGDQQSLFSEFRDVIKAGLSLGLSGVPFWSFDIGGFANKLPSKELYIRWTSMAVFAPIFQWHSEPTFGQFADVIKGDGGINDRSPWNMADYHNDDELLFLGCYFANMRMNMLPYVYQVAQDCAKNSKPMFKHLYYENQNDANTVNIEDEFMLGDLLIAPIVHERENKRDIYLPKGRWENIFTGSEFDGKMSICENCEIDEVSVFIKNGKGMMLNLNADFELGASVGNGVDNFANPCIYISGDLGSYAYKGAGIDCSIIWVDGKVELTGESEKEVFVLSSKSICNMVQIGTTKFNLNTLGIYKKEEG